MATITLQEAIILKSTISNRLAEYLHERREQSYVEFEKGETPVCPENADTVFKDTSKKIDETQADLLSLTALLAKTNLSTTLEFQGITIPLTVALAHVKQLRADVTELNRFATSKEVERVQTRFGDTSVTYKKALFNPSEIRENATEIERLANKLSFAIDRTNLLTTVEFDAADKYL